VIADQLNALRRRYIKPWGDPIKRVLRPVRPWRKTNLGGIQVHYRNHLHGGGREFGQWFIPFFQARGMPKQARVFEWCAGPGFIGFSLLGHGLAETLCLADINIEAVVACRRTIADNGLADGVSVYHSDNLASIPASEQWDLVVSNPPHFVDMYQGDIRAYDPDWRIHGGFFTAIGRHLKPGGVIVLQEQNAGSTVDTFRPMIAAAGLKVVFAYGCEPERTQTSRLYFLGVMRAGDTPPAWALPA
jgi:16S rRNA G966 N2-methylase RsmD